jgi:trehalose-6-phosphate synthase
VGQLIIVSNRVSVPEKGASARAGGLEVAVNAALERSGIWFGWSGRIATRGTIATHMVRTLLRDDIRRWAHNFLSALEREPSTSELFKTQSVQ